MNQTTDRHSLFLVPLQVQEVLQVVRTLVLRLLPQQPDSGQFVRPLQLGPPQPALGPLGLHFPQHRSVPSHFLQLPFPSVIFGSSLMILSLFFSPCSCPGVFISSRSRSSIWSARFRAFFSYMGPMLYFFSMWTWRSCRRRWVKSLLDMASRQRFGWAHNPWKGQPTDWLNFTEPNLEWKGAAASASWWGPPGRDLVL